MQLTHAIFNNKCNSNYLHKYVINYLTILYRPKMTIQNFFINLDLIKLFTTG